MSKLEIFLLLVAFTNVFLVVEFVRRRRLQEGYALLWIAVGIGGLAVVTLRHMVDDLAHIVGVSYGANLFLAAGVQFLVMVAIALSLHISRLEDRVERLAEEVAFLRGARPPKPDGPAPEAITKT